MKIINVKGNIIPSSYAWYFDFLEIENTSPKKIIAELNAANGEPVEIHVNSSGGEISAGSEIYTAIREYAGDVTIKIVGYACSAASIIATARYCEMSPTALMMVHRVSTRAAGNANDFEKTATTLKTADEALCSAYVAKSSKLSKETALQMMDNETWLNAEKALEYGLIDKIMFDENEPMRMTASSNDFKLPTKEAMNKVKQMLEDKQKNKSTNYQKAKSEMDFLKMKGVIL